MMWLLTLDSNFKGARQRSECRLRVGADGHRPLNQVAIQLQHQPGPELPFFVRREEDQRSVSSGWDPSLGRSVAPDPDRVVWQGGQVWIPTMDLWSDWIPRHSDDPGSMICVDPTTNIWYGSMIWKDPTTNLWYGSMIWRDLTTEGASRRHSSAPMSWQTS